MSLVPSWSVVEQFERRVAEYVGAPHAVAVDTCTAGLFLCLKYDRPLCATVPNRTYLGVMAAVVHSGVKPVLSSINWRGAYTVAATSRFEVVDSACRFTAGAFDLDRSRRTYRCPQLMCFSFQYRKHLKIGRGGMVATNDAAAAEWLRKARFLGRGEHGGEPEFVGWHAFMEPERAARGLVLMDSLPQHNDDLVFEYPDLSTYDCLKEHLA